MANASEELELSKGRWGQEGLEKDAVQCCTYITCRSVLKVLFSTFWWTSLTELLMVIMHLPRRPWKTQLELLCLCP